MSSAYYAEVTRRDRVRLVALACSAGLVTVGAALGGRAAIAGSAASLVLLLAVFFGRRLFDLRALTMIALLLLFFIPARSVAVAISFPIDPEPYRLVVGLLAVLWIVALLVDPRVRLRATAFDRPILLFFLIVLISIVANAGLVSIYSDSVIKGLLMMLSSFLIYFMLASILETRDDVDFIVTIIVACATALAVAAIAESATGYNLFAHVDQLPGLVLDPAAGSEELARDGARRATASAEHPIALGALFALITPLSVYLASRRGAWLAATFVLMLGCAVTVSRTPLVMLAVSLAVFAIVRPRYVVGVIAVLPVAVTAAYLLLPNVVGPVTRSFLPAEGLFQQQSGDLREGGAATVGRLVDIEYALEDVRQRPLVGGGVGTRPHGDSEVLFSDDGRYLGILDNQWLGVLLDFGVLGVAVLIWLFITSSRQLLSAARAHSGPDGWLALAFAASGLSFATGMLFFDAFGFSQVEIMFFVTLACGAVLLRTLPEPDAHVDDAPDWHRHRVVSQLQRVMTWSAKR